MINNWSVIVRLGPLVICGLLVLAMRYVWLSTDQMLILVRDWGYWMMATVFIGFVWAMVGLFGCLKKSVGGLFNKTNKWPLAGVLMLIVWQQIYEPHRLKVEFDESLLLSMSRSMHFEHKAAWSSSAQKYDGSTMTVSYGVDKRPLFFPFCVSLLHSSTGYRVANVWIFNGLVGAFLLFGTYWLGTYYNHKWGGFLAAALLAGVPLVAQNATGGGFDLFNLLIIVILVISVREYIGFPTKQKLLAMCLCSVALANIRYESILYVLVPCLAFGWVAWRERAWPEIPRLVALLPLGLLPSLLTNGVFNSQVTFFQMPKEKFWQVTNVTENLSHAMYYIFSPDRGGTNSPLLAAVGVISLLFFGFIIKDQFSTKKEVAAESAALLCLLVCGGLHLFLLMGLAWGKWDDPIVSRFSLPLWFLFMWCALELLRHAKERFSDIIFKGGAGVALLWIFFFANADSSSAMQTRRMKASIGLEWATQFVEKYDPGRTVLVLADSSIAYINRGYAAISYGELEDSIPQSLATVKYGLYREVLLVLSQERGAKIGDWVADLRLKEFAKKCKVEKLDGILLDPFYRLTIYRITGINDGVKIPPFPKIDDTDPDGEMYKKRVYKLFP